jgi:hypothetical protein
MNDDPYSPPENPPGVGLEAVKQCPVCGAGLEIGLVSGRLHWLPADARAIDFLFGGRRLLGSRFFSLRIVQAPEPALRCPGCDLILVAPGD